MRKRHSILLREFCSIDEKIYLGEIGGRVDREDLCTIEAH